MSNNEQDMVEKFKILNEKMFKESENLYKTDNGHSDILFKFLSRLRLGNEGAYNTITRGLLTLDKDLDSKGSFIQKVAINRLLLEYLLFLRAAYNVNVSNAIVCCDNSLKDDVWLSGIFNTVMPVLLNNLDM